MAIYTLPAEFPALAGFDWDEANAMKNEKHSVSDAEAEQLFVNEPLLVLQDAAHSSSEERWHALGRTNEGRMLHATFTLRAGGARVRIISARPMHRKERKVYDSASQAKP
ncbi:MAG: BrnT family toxin [Usitatibacter sp.]